MEKLDLKQNCLDFLVRDDLVVLAIDGVKYDSHWPRMEDTLLVFLYLLMVNLAALLCTIRVSNKSALSMDSNVLQNNTS